MTHRQLLRSVDAPMHHQGEFDDCVAGLLRPLIDDERSVVFYDLTTIRTEGLSEQAGDVRRFGLSKEGRSARQFRLGVVQTSCSMPIYHEVFAGNAAEAPTLLPTLVKVLARYPHIRRLIVAADRRLLPLKSEIEIALVFHRLSERLRLAGSELSPEAALERLRRIHHHRVSIKSAAPITGVSTINDEQAGVFAALKLKKPTNNLRMSLL